MKQLDSQQKPTGIHWLEQNDKTEKGIQIINSISQEQFSQVLDRIIKVKSKQSEPLTGDEIKQLSQSFELNVDQLKLALKTVFYIYDRLSKFLFKPSELQKYLVSILKLKEDKSDEFVKQWTSTLKNVFEDRRKVDNVKWNLNMQIASSSNATEAIPTATLQFDAENSGEEPVTLRLTYEDVLRLYESLENIQNEIDYVRSLNVNDSNKK